MRRTIKRGQPNNAGQFAKDTRGKDQIPTAALTSRPEFVSDDEEKIMVDEAYSAWQSSPRISGSPQTTIVPSLGTGEALKEVLWQGPPSQHADAVPARIPLVVYGTLRQGGTLDDGVLEGENVDSESPRLTAYIPGAIYESTEGDWPLLDPKEPGWVTCEVVSMDSSPEQGAWNKMGTDEIGWGYNVEYVSVSEYPGGPSVGTALVCTWPWPNHRGRKVESGDWMQRDK